MIDHNSLITKKWDYFKYRILGTDIIVEIKAEGKRAAEKIMHDNYPDKEFIEIKE